ncbi:MAG: hypothetical protein ACE5GS_12235 [Kiloniellaceae bacterium]
MKRVRRYGLHVVAVLGVFLTAGSAVAGRSQAAAGATAAPARQSIAPERASGPSRVQLATHLGAQTATVPVGTIRLRVIPRVGAKALRTPIRWQVMTFGRDASGQRHKVAEVTGPTPELVLPAGWYVVHAHLADKVIKHPVEVTAGRTFKYTLVKN